MKKLKNNKQKILAHNLFFHGVCDENQFFVNRALRLLLFFLLFPLMAAEATESNGVKFPFCQQVVTLASLRTNDQKKIADPLAIEKIAWAKTGFDLRHLIALPELQVRPAEMVKNKFIGLSVAFSFFARELTVPQQIVFDEKNKRLSLEKLPDNHKQSLKSLNSYFSDIWSKELTSSNLHLQGARQLLEIIEKVIFLAKEYSNPKDIPYLAGNTYSIYLNHGYDPHSYATPEHFLQASNNYVGIGVLVKVFDLAGLSKPYSGSAEEMGLVVAPFANSPAEKAGLIEGDVILEIDRKPINASEDLLSIGKNRMSGPEGSFLHLLVSKYDPIHKTSKVETVILQRKAIVHQPTPLTESRFVSIKNKVNLLQLGDKKSERSAQADLVGPQALYVPVRSFLDTKLCYQFLQLQAIEMSNPDSAGMIVDLRGNGGGDLGVVKCMLSTIIYGDEKPMIKKQVVHEGQLTGQMEDIAFFANTFGLRKVITRRGAKIELNLSPSQYPIEETFSYQKPIVVLVDEKSASASELFAGVVQEKGRGWVVGRGTFGKGSIQERSTLVSQYSLSPDHPITISKTTGLYALPSGRLLQNQGIVPDFYFDEYGTPLSRNDADVHFTESNFINSLPVNTEKWIQPRQDDIDRIFKVCAQGESSLSADHKDQLAKNPYLRGRIWSVDYQTLLARDLIRCMAQN